MVFPLKTKNKLSKNNSISNIGKFKLIISRVKYVAKNVVFVNKLSQGDLDKSSKSTNINLGFQQDFDFTFKNFKILLVRDPHPLLNKAKALRHESFFKGAKREIDSDEFDSCCDHLIVIDRSISEDHVVGTYRLLVKNKIVKSMKFYSESEFDLTNLLKMKNISMLEAGRSCVHENYRDGRIIKLLWRGLAYYIVKKKIDLIFGCASFPSSDFLQFKRQLSYLNYFHKPPKKYSTSPLFEYGAKLNYINPKDIDSEQIFRTLPPLIKAYIRVGAWVGQGAVVDKKFDTTDVFIILKSKNIIKKYSNLSFK